MKVLLLGNGAREHALAEALTKSGRVQLATYAKAKNPGIFERSEAGYHIGLFTDFPAIREFAKKVRPDFAFIGPDDPIADGVADLLLEEGIHSVAPLKALARLESSKSFARDLVQKYNIPGNPHYKVFTSGDGIREWLFELHGQYVVKADGLMGGKGVHLSGEHLATMEDGERYSLQCIEKFGRVVIEEKLVGQEFSLMSFVDGKHVADMVPVQDHKRAFNGDMGPNTGGMGSYSDADHSLPFLEKRDLEEAHDITVRVAEALFKETGVFYKGIMYGGFMAVRDGVRLIEYNARFGDPEAMNVLPILKNDFVDVCEGILAGTLHQQKIEFEAKATVCKYLVPEGYPDNPRSGEKITLALPDASTKVYYSSVDQREEGLFTSSSRAIALVGIAGTIAEAERIAEKACAGVSGPLFHRSDIGTDALLEKRKAVMRELRGA